MTHYPPPGEMLLAWLDDSLAAADDVRLWTLGPAELGRRVTGMAEVAGESGKAGDVDLSCMVSAGRADRSHFAVGAGVGQTLAAMHRLRRAARTAERPEVIHAWSLHAAAMGAWAYPGVPIVLTTPTAVAVDADGPPAMWMRAALRRAGSICWLSPQPPSAGQLGRWRLERVRTMAIDPPVNAARFAAADDRTRCRLGWAVTDDRTRIVVMLSDQAERIQSLSALLGVGLAWETGRDIRLLISPHAGQLERAMRVVRDLGRSERVIVDEVAEAPWRIAHAVDAVLVLGDGLSVAWATAAGLPTLVPREPGDGAGDDGRGSGGAASHGLLDAVYGRPDSPAPGRIAPHVNRLFDDFAEAKRAATALRPRARELYDPLRYRRRLADVYEAAANGRPPTWPAITTGGTFTAAAQRYRG